MSARTRSLLMGLCIQLIKYLMSVCHERVGCGRCSVIQSCPSLCDPMDCSMPGSFVVHHLLEFAQIHVH